MVVFCVLNRHRRHRCELGHLSIWLEDKTSLRLFRPLYASLGLVCPFPLYIGVTPDFTLRADLGDWRIWLMKTFILYILPLSHWHNGQGFHKPWWKLTIFVECQWYPECHILCTPPPPTPPSKDPEYSVENPIRQVLLLSFYSELNLWTNNFAKEYTTSKCWGLMNPHLLIWELLL